MVVDTRSLFRYLLPALRIETVCDIGSMDGADALEFRRALPAARIYALEPNPQNFDRMSSDDALHRSAIRLAAFAAAESDGEADFFLTDPDRPAGRGMSSLYPRTDSWAPRGVVKVRTTRVDTFLARARLPCGRLALWIDAEGKAYEVIEGAAGALHDLYLLHLEVETTPCIGSDQKLYPDVKGLLQRLGFHEFATDQPPGSPQFNAIFLRDNLDAVARRRVRVCLVRARFRRARVRCRRAAGLLVARFCPACMRRLRAIRMNLRPRAGYSSRGTSRAS